jgi:hypothetical protein
VEDESAELSELISEQKADDTHQVMPEFPGSVPLDSIEEHLGVTPDGQRADFLPRQRGTVLSGTASWHGTNHGYTRQRCRCVRCKGAHAEALAKYRAAKKASQ